ncbi:MAG: transglycosylase domain-containing protein [Candidatus Zambryskibacteria bacterium]|nr:transglycosylase domain-containing protein [Candidatus Zambryskibacteria bacterium]
MKKYISRASSLLKKNVRKAKVFGIRNILIGLSALSIIFLAIILIWITTFKLPTLDEFRDRKTTESTKIYDRTGKVLLFDIFQEQKRTIIGFDAISPYIKQATLSIEDQDFYTHNGVKPTAFLRALFVNVTSLSYSQGGSTITQQVIKKTVLSGDKKATRKVKEWILAIRLEKILTKNEIFELYLNEIPYGGNYYGVEEASQAYFGKKALDVSIAEAAYLAALPQAPSFYSPYGKNKKALDERKDVVLKEMKQLGYISEEQYTNAREEVVVFLPKEDKGIKAPHFVMFVKEYLIKKYGEEVLENGGLRVTTTVNYDLQKKAEEIALKYALINKKAVKGKNDSFVVIDPKTGEILTMVGSRNYFDKEIDGQFNIATAKRQPGSTFKPFIYAESFNKGYTPETVLFNTETQFSTACPVDSMSSVPPCYSPKNYNSKYPGPVTLRDALASSMNVPAVKLLYLVGVQNAINLAKTMGVTSLGDANQYGLTLVLGGGEVSLLDMTSAYGVFANDGTRVPYAAILKIEDSKGNILEEHTPKSTQVLNPESARRVSSILSDNVARAPLFGSNSLVYFGGRDVAAKTGTTNNNKDGWLIGYTPSVVVGAWAGNNENTPMIGMSGTIIAPMWRALMDEAMKTVPSESFIDPVIEDSYDLKPILRGKWRGGISIFTSPTNTQQTTPPQVNPLIPINTASTEPLPYESTSETLSGGVHSILHWVNRNDPRGPVPTNPESDPQYKYWEYSVQKWAQANGY